MRIKKYSFRPDVSQLYVLESNKKNTLTNPVVYTSTGKSIPYPINPPLPAGEAEPSINFTDVDDSNLEPVSVEDRSTAAKTVRVCDLLCYICKVRLGADHSHRTAFL